MKTRRTARVSAAVQQIVSSAILFELRDPRVKNVTVLGAETADDMRSAKVIVSVMGDAGAQRLTLHGLDSARGFLQSRIADELGLRYTPILTFELSQGIKQSAAVSELLREMNQDSEESDDFPDDGPNGGPNGGDAFEDPGGSTAEDSVPEKPELE